MENVIPMFFCVALFLFAFRVLPICKHSGLSFIELVFFFGLKVLFGYMLIGVYTKFYPQRNVADVFKYFDDAMVIFNNAQLLRLSIIETFQQLIAHQNHDLIKYTQHFDKQGSGFFEANHHLIIYIQLLLRYISNGNIYFHSLWFSFFSMLGAVGIYASLKKHFNGTEYLLKVVVFGIPSVLFWSSGMLKETLILLSLGLIAYSFTERKRISDWESIPLFICALLFLLFVKPYVLLGVILSAFTYWIFKQSNIKGLLFSLFILNITALYFWGNNIANQLIHKRNEFITLSEHSNTQSLLHHSILPENGYLELLKITPSSLYAVFFEPSIFHLNSMKDFPFCFENVLLIAVLLFLLIRYFQFNRPKLAMSAALFVFAFSLLMIIGWTVPVSGAIVRYKVSALPFLIISILLHINLRLFKYEINSIMGLKNDEILVEKQKID